MKPTTINRWLLPLIVVMCIALGAGSAWAQAPSWTFAGTGLRQVGPLNFFGYPSFITDANNTSLEPCLVSPVDPTAPVADPCALTGTLQLGDAQPIVFVSNFPQEFFYSNASVVLDVGGVKNSITYLTALEGGFTAGFPLTPNQQVVFIRTRFRVDGGLIAGASYRVTHPYGTIDFVAEAGGKLKQITTDIGCLTAPCGSFNQLTTAVGPDGHATIGPFLQAVNPPPPAGYVGDPNILQSVTGSPTENNFFRLERIDPVAGAVLVVETDQFSLWGKLFTGTQPPPQLSIDRTTYARNASATTVNGFLAQPLSCLRQPAASSSSVLDAAQSRSEHCPSACQSRRCSKRPRSLSSRPRPGMTKTRDGPGRPVRLMPTPMMGSEDFSYVLRQVPGTLMFLGTRPDGDAPAIPNHSNRMVVNETAMATGVALHAAVALRFLDGKHGARPA